MGIPILVRRYIYTESTLDRMSVHPGVYLSICPALTSFRPQHFLSLRWRQNEWDGVSNHQPYDCLLNCLSGRRSKKTSKPASLAFVLGIPRRPVNSPHKWPVTRKLFPFDDFFMYLILISSTVIDWPHRELQPRSQRVNSLALGDFNLILGR